MSIRKAFDMIGMASAATVLTTAASAQSGERCAVERGLYAQRNMPRAPIAITNQANYPVRVFWINSNGVRVPYRSLAPGQTFRSLSFVSHPWVVTDTSGNCRQVFFTENDDQTFVFNAPPARQRYEPEEEQEGPDTIEPLTEGDAGQVIDIAVGQETTIALRSNLSTGYSWEVASTTNLRVIGDVTEERPRNSMPGAGGTSLVSFRIITRGRAGITLRYVPPGGGRPQRTLVYRFVGV